MSGGDGLAMQLVNSGAAQSLFMTVLSELGDKTFFIAAVMAMRFSRVKVCVCMCVSMLVVMVVELRTEWWNNASSPVWCCVRAIERERERQDVHECKHTTRIERHVCMRWRDHSYFTYGERERERERCACAAADDDNVVVSIYVCAYRCSLARCRQWHS